MSGHNKWSKIKHKKGAADAKRSKVFTRIIKEITVAARDGGGDIDGNPKLRLAVQNGKGANMPKDVIERAIKKGVGGDGASLIELTFEGTSPNGIAVFVECTTDNNKRTIADVRMVFNKYNGDLGKNGSLSYLFDRKGVFTISTEKLEGRDLEELEMELIDGGLEELEAVEDKVILTVGYEDFGKMNEFLEEMKIEVESAELQRIANNETALDVDKAKSVIKMLDAMEELDDVNNVYHNLEMTDDLAAALEE
jgi:YebC/PmpR family DNA-binding regulatory protein